MVLEIKMVRFFSGSKIDVKFEYFFFQLLFRILIWDDDIIGKKGTWKKEKSFFKSNLIIVKQNTAV